MRRLIATLAATLPLILASALPGETLEKLPPSPRLRVLAWNGPPAEQCTAPRMQELAEAGFTDSFSRFPSLDWVRKALDAAQTADVKLWVISPELKREPEATVRQLQHHPALGGYFLVDEPGVKQFAELAAWAARIRAVDKTHPCYINLFPNYATPLQMQVDTYDEYIERYVREVPELPISFDFYPISAAGLNGGWYVNLATIADAARESQRPFWAFALSVAYGDHPVATTGQVRLQVYSDLAYGAQAIQYFTYWTPPHFPPGDDFHDGPINLAGHRTVVFDRLQEVNAELQALSAVFVGSNVDKVAHAGEKIPAGTERFQPSAPVVALSADSGAIVSQLTNGNRKYLVVVNRSYEQPMDFWITLDPAVAPSLVTKRGHLQPLADGKYQAEVGPGDAEIFSWNSGEK